MNRTIFVAEIKKGCADCPAFDSDRKICSFIRSDTGGDIPKRVAYGEIKLECPFHTADNIVLKPLFWKDK